MSSQVDTHGEGVFDSYNYAAILETPLWQPILQQHNLK